MPVDPSILNKYDPRTPAPGPEREGLLPLILTLIGSPALLAFAWLADGRSLLIQVFFVLAAVAGSIAALTLAYIGYQENGITGIFFHRKYPLGSVFTGDPPPSWLRFSVGWLLILAGILCGFLISRTPEAIPENWVRHSRTGSSVRDQLMK